MGISDRLEEQVENSGRHEGQMENSGRLEDSGRILAWRSGDGRIMKKYVDGLVRMKWASRGMFCVGKGGLSGIS